MSRTLKVTGNHVMYDLGARFLKVIMSSSRALCCSPSGKKEKHDFHLLFVQCIIKQLLDNQGLGEGDNTYHDLEFWISQKPHPIIVLYLF